jgi:hypothetical protein
MALGNLISATAYEISPRQEGPFDGGLVENLADLGAALADKSMIDALRDGTPVSFDFDNEARVHPVRDALMTFAFGTAATRVAASQELAARLASKMDGRNKNCLLLISVHEVASSEALEAIAWMFPYDQVIQRTGGRVALQDAFSLTSGLRKAAAFRGLNLRTGFLSGVALDHQSSNTDQKVAQFWITKFLGGALQVQSREGTLLAAKVFRAANKTLAGDEVAQAALVAAIGQLRSRTDKRWTIQEIADTLLPGGASREAFTAAAGHGPETRSPFDLDLQRFDQKVKYRVFKLDNGITVSAPFVEIGAGVTIEQSSEGQSRLTATGTIAGEALRSNP